MPKGKSSRVTIDDLDTAEELYRATGNPKYVMLAIGDRPARPPLWAIDACIRFVDESARLSTSGSEHEILGSMLDEVARQFINLADRQSAARIAGLEPPTGSLHRFAREAVSRVRGKPLDEVSDGDSDVQRVERAWRKEARKPVTEYEIVDGVAMTRRLMWAHLEQGDAEAGFPFSRIDQILARHRAGA